MFIDQLMQSSKIKEVSSFRASVLQLKKLSHREVKEAFYKKKKKKSPSQDSQYSVYTDTGWRQSNPSDE